MRKVSEAVRTKQTGCTFAHAFRRPAPGRGSTCQPVFSVRTPVIRRSVRSTTESTMSHSRHLDGKCAPLHDLSVWIISTSGMELATMLETLSCGFNPTSQPHIDATTMERSLATTNACARSRGRPSPRPRPKHLWHRLDACTEGELSARTASRMPAARPQPRFQRFRRPLRQARLRRQVCRHELAMAHSKRLMTYVKSPRERESCRRTPVPCGASPCGPKV